MTLKYLHKHFRVRGVIISILVITIAILIIIDSEPLHENTKYFSASSIDAAEKIQITNLYSNQSYQPKYLNPLQRISVDYYGSLNEYEVPIDTVKNTLKRIGIGDAGNDILFVEPDEYIYSGETIVIAKLKQQETNTQEVIPFSVVEIPSDDMLIGESEVFQKGENGMKLCKKQQQYYNGKLWREWTSEETVIRASRNQIVKIGTQNIIENTNVNTESENTVLLKMQNDISDFQLPRVSLSEKDRDLLERLLTGEFGSSFVGASLVAQAIKCAIVYDHYTSMEDLIQGMGYVGSTNIGKTQNAVDAARFIFDENGLAVKHRLFYMCTENYYNSAPGNFHSTQNFILQYENVKFFDRW